MIRQCYAFSIDMEVVSVSTCTVLLEDGKEREGKKSFRNDQVDE